jgi:hypothetical protein
MAGLLNNHFAMDRFSLKDRHDSELVNWGFLLLITQSPRRRRILIFSHNGAFCLSKCLYFV